MTACSFRYPLPHKKGLIPVSDAAAFQNASNGVRTLYIASLSSGIRGAGNAVLVPSQSSVQSFAELKGETISVPFGSTAHAALLRAIQDQGWDPEKDVTLVSQAPEVGGSALKTNQIDVHADFVPSGELFPFRGFSRKIYDGSFTGVTTTHGVRVRSDFAAKYLELVVAYLRATLKADRLLREKPEELSEKLAGWTGIEAEVVYAFHGPAGIQARDYTLKPEIIAAIRKAEETLRQLKKTDKRVDVDAFVTDKFMRQAAKPRRNSAWITTRASRTTSRSRSPAAPWTPGLPSPTRIWQDKSGSRARNGCASTVRPKGRWRQPGNSRPKARRSGSFTCTTVSPATSCSRTRPGT